MALQAGQPYATPHGIAGKCSQLARLALVRGGGLVIASGLDVYGVEPVEEMR